MTKTKKTILMTLLSSMLIFCAALGAILSTPLSSVRADSVDYTNWTRTAMQQGDTLANKYILIDKTIANAKGDYIVFDRVITPSPSLGRIYYNPTDEEKGAGFPPHSLAGDAGLEAVDGAFVEFQALQTTDTFAVYYITPYTVEAETQFSNPLTQTSTVHTFPDGFFFITEPEDGTTGSGSTSERPSTGQIAPQVPTNLPELNSANYTITYLSECEGFKGSYFVIPENILTGNIIIFDLQDSDTNPYIRFSYAHYMTYYSCDATRQALLSPIAVTYSNGVKSYVYDFTKNQTITDSNGESFLLDMTIFEILKARATEGADYDTDVTVLDCYIFTEKTTEKDYTDVLKNRTGKELKAGDTLCGKFLFVSGNSTVLNVQYKNSNGTQNGALEFTKSSDGWTWVFKDYDGNAYTKHVVLDDDGYATYNGVEGYVFDFTEEVVVFYPLEAGRYITYSINDTVKVNSIETDGEVYLFETSNSFGDSNNTFTIILTIAGTVVLFVVLVWGVKKIISLL